MTNVTRLSARRAAAMPAPCDPRLAHLPQNAGRPVRGGGIAGPDYDRNNPMASTAKAQGTGHVELPDVVVDAITDAEERPAPEYRPLGE